MLGLISYKWHKYSKYEFNQKKLSTWFLGAFKAFQHFIWKIS